MRRHARILAAFVTLAIHWGGSAHALTYDEMSAMFRTMLTMMSVWNAINHPQIGRDYDGQYWPGRSDYFPAYPDPWKRPRDYGSGYPGGWNRAWDRPPWWDGWAFSSTPKGHPLSGAWVGMAGEMLVITGNRFRIQSHGGQHATGVFFISGNYFVAHIPASQATRRYRITLRGNTLTFRDELGQTLFFRRV